MLNEEMNVSKALRLQVYTSSHCVNCEEAKRLAQTVARMFPDVAVEVIDLDLTPGRSADVYAVPTYVLNNEVCYLGNPSLEDLYRTLRQKTGDHSNLVDSESTDGG
jgi:disulfide oxidoreductase YuzD